MGFTGHSSSLGGQQRTIVYSFMYYLLYVNYIITVNDDNAEHNEDDNEFYGDNCDDNYNDDNVDYNKTSKVFFCYPITLHHSSMLAGSGK